jgi:hypothetical protein
MDVPRHIARSRVIFCLMAAALVAGISGCNTFALEPSDFWPSKETWDKLSPSNLWYDLQPTRLQRLNEGNPAMSSDAYYSVPDPLPPDVGSTAVVEPAAAATTESPSAPSAAKTVVP